MVLVNNSRLSVQPVTDQEFERVRKMAKGNIK
jgi:predicted RNA-binding protein with PUA-like domain